MTKIWTPRTDSRILRWCVGHVALLAVLVLCSGVELALQGADHGLWGSVLWRGLAYQNGGFWIGLLGNWQPNYAAQPVAMFATYGFLHGGFAHLAVNMITLLSLGSAVIGLAGQRGFLAIYALSVLGGAAGFAILSQAVQPMVGASGALFGLAGALVAWDWRDRRVEGETLWPVLRAVALLGLLNLLMYWALDGRLAWETHLGGFLAGWAAGLWLARRRPPV